MLIFLFKNQFLVRLGSADQNDIRGQNHATFDVRIISILPKPLNSKFCIDWMNNHDYSSVIQNRIVKVKIKVENCVQKVAEWPPKGKCERGIELFIKGGLNSENLGFPPGNLDKMRETLIENDHCSR